MRLAVALSVFAVAALLATTASAEVIRVQSTTDVHDSGQWEEVFEKPYLKLHPTDSFSTEFVGTGKALKNAEEGKADVVITHAPVLEEEFVAKGFSFEELGRSIFYNDYVIVGPKSDPAGVKANDLHNAVGAFERIAATGGTGKASFVSRNDASGTNVQEQILWGLSSVTPKREACNGTGGTEREEPGEGPCTGGVPKWYVQTGLGQAANLLEANECLPAKAPDGGCYTMLDRGTWIANEGKASNMMIVSEGNSEGIDGPALQTNYFHAYVLNPAKFEEGKKPNTVSATRFVEFLTSPKTQEAIGVYPTEEHPAGTGDAVAFVTYTHTAPSGGKSNITATLKYGAPPQPLLPSYPNVQLQKFTSGWEDIPGQAGTTNASGQVTFTGVEVGASPTKFRVRMPQFAVHTKGIFTLFTAGPATSTTHVP